MMNKPYFTKYLPDPNDQKIKKGDTYEDILNPAPGAFFKCQSNEEADTLNSTGCEKYSLYVCTKGLSNISIGDKVHLERNPIYNKEGEFILDKLFEKVCQENPLLFRHLFKIIGEVSYGALPYVNENDEFNQNELCYVNSWGEIHEGYFYLIDELIKRGETDYSVGIKGPCGHFH